MLQDSSIRVEITRSIPWRLAFLPDRRIDMTMVFNHAGGYSNADNRCPRCQFPSDENNVAEVQWQVNCLLV